MSEIRVAERKARADAVFESCPEGGGVHTGDLSLLYDLVPDDRVDLFFTDPPWADAGLYRELARLAQKKLKPRGLCLAYAGHPFLPATISAMGEQLDYTWLFAVSHSGSNTRIWDQRVSCGFKPVLVFAKRPKPTLFDHEWVTDLVKGQPDKNHHEWGQSVDEALYWIERLTEPGALVVDPFCGGGTVPVACRVIGRRCVATELDPSTAAVARGRVLSARPEHFLDPKAAAEIVYLQKQTHLFEDDPRGKYAREFPN